LYQEAVSRRGSFKQRLLGKCIAAQTLQRSLVVAE